MKPRNTILATGLTSLLMAQAALGLGLGEIKLNSALNEPMDAEVELLGAGELSDLEILVGLGSNDEFKRAGVDREFFLTQLRFAADFSDPQRPVIRISSREPIKEPYLDFLMEVQWPAGRLLREYTVLMDLPLFATEAPQAKRVETASSGSQSRPQSQNQSQRATQSQRPQSPTRSSSSKPALAGGDNYRVDSGDSLWAIARRVRPDGASIHQTMAAIHSLNTEAFIGGDINLLKKGSVLRLPEGSETRSVDEAAAQQLASRTFSTSQDEGDFAATDNALDATSQQRSAPASDSQPDGRLKLTAPDSGAALNAGAGSDDASEAMSAAARDRVNSVEEQLDKTSRENAELRDRLSNLEQQIETMRRLVELNDPTLSALQNKAADSAQPGEGENLAGEQLASTSAAIESGAEDPLGANELASVAEPEQTAAEPVASETLPATVSKDVQPATTASEPAWQRWLNMLMYPLIGLLAVVLAVFLFFRNRSSEDEYDTFEPQEPIIADEPEEVTAEAALTEEDLAIAADMGETITDEDLSGLELGDDEDVDPEGEADIYLALGNYAQAEGTLQDALAEQPGNSALHLKLLEVYVASNNQSGFDEQFEKLDALNDVEASEEARRLQSELGLDGAELLSEEDLSSEEDLASEEGQDQSDGDELLETDAGIEFDLGSSEESSQEPEQEADFDLASELEPPVEFESSADQPSSDESSSDEEVSVAATSDDLDFDLELELDDLDMESLSNDIDGLSLDSDELVSESDSDDLDLTFDEVAPAAESDSADDNDEGSTEEESDSEAPVSESATSENVDDLLSDIDADLEMLPEADECTTKLDLAEAFLEMGDQDGAREILDEVVSEGNDQQQEKARSLLESIS